MTEDRLKELEADAAAEPANGDPHAPAVLELVAEVRLLRAERLSYKAKLVDQRWDIEQAARKAERERCAKLADEAPTWWGGTDEGLSCVKAEAAIIAQAIRALK